VVFAGPRVLETFKGRRSRSENDGTSNEFSAYNRQVSGVVPNPLTLFKGTVVLLVNHDNTEVFHRREDR
jgi:hypothetical protein